MANELVQLMIDAYKGNIGTKFTKEQVQDSLREELNKILGTESGKPINLYANKAKMWEVFALIQEALTQIIPMSVEEQFNDFAEYKEYGFGDKPIFELPQNPYDNLFEVAVISEGNGQIRRQKISDAGFQTIETYWMGVAIVEDLTRFLAGRTDWVAMVANVARSYNRKIAVEIYNAFINAYDSISAPFKVTGAYDEDELAELMQYVKAATESDVIIVGTMMGLGKVGPGDKQMVSEAMKNEYYQLGRYGQFRGAELRELKQSFVPLTTNWALDDKTLLVLPTGGVKPVKVVTEGTAMIEEKMGTESKNGSMEYNFKLKSGVAVLQTTKYGIYKMA